MSSTDSTAPLRKARKTKSESGRLRIGDDWNAITIIALSQNNPLKAIAEFVENSIDARAKHVTIQRGKEKGQHYLRITDDGNGIPLGEDGLPNFKYVATHICDSIKRRLKEQGAGQNIQGEFGIGLLSFWTVGHRLTVISSGRDGKTYQMVMNKGQSGYKVMPRPHLVAHPGTQLIISPLLEGNRLLTGEKIQRYLASELRDRIRNSEIKITVIDRVTRMQAQVEPRRFEGQLIHNLPSLTTPLGDIYTELYLNESSAENRISLFRCGTRVLPDISVLDEFQKGLWEGGYFQGIIDAPFLNLTPGTRDGIIRDENFSIFCQALSALRDHLSALAEEQSRAEDARVSKNILRSVQKAFREAILALPQEEYDWFDLPGQGRTKPMARPTAENELLPQLMPDQSHYPIDDQNINLTVNEKGQKQFFEFSGPLFCAKIQPSSVLLQVGSVKTFCAVGQDKRKRRVDENLQYQWQIVQGGGTLDNNNGEMITYSSPTEPGISQIKVTVTQGETACEALATITIAAELIKSPKNETAKQSQGLPGYTYENAPGQLWRSKFDEKQNLIIVNTGHRDFIYSSGNSTRKLRYICRLFAKELIIHNFQGLPADQLLERLIELTLYTEENLK